MNKPKTERNKKIVQLRDENMSKRSFRSISLEMGISDKNVRKIYYREKGVKMTKTGAIILSVALFISIIALWPNIVKRNAEYNHHMCVDVYGLNDQCK